MKTVFVDSVYWVAILDEADQHQRAAAEAAKALGPTHLVTTEEVLVEVFSVLSRAPIGVRQAAVTLVRRLLQGPNVTVVPQSHESFLAGLDLYEKRLDQGYSLVDCVSMSVMRRRRIREALTSDRHFGREGYRVLMRIPS